MAPPYYVTPPDPPPDNRHPPVPHADEAIACVPYVPWSCPRCGDRKPRTYSQNGRVRYHECQQCGIRYRSLEVDPGIVRTIDELRGMF